MAPRNRLTSIDTTSAVIDLDGGYDADDFSTTTAQTLSVGTDSNRLLGFTQTLSRGQGTRTFASTSAQVGYRRQPHQRRPAKLPA
ncbi:MAG: hypothetical protein IAE92_13655 [Burkholderiaceae bacterium]|mgnify:CR=1 FL=1|nr:hypothetical protein [Burkholderiaceae bacterium]